MNDRVNVLEGKKILIFPDVDAYDYWKEKFKVRPIETALIIVVSYETYLRAWCILFVLQFDG